MCEINNTGKGDRRIENGESQCEIEKDKKIQNKGFHRINENRIKLPGKVQQVCNISYKQGNKMPLGFFTQSLVEMRSKIKK